MKKPTKIALFAFAALYVLLFVLRFAWAMSRPERPVFQGRTMQANAEIAQDSFGGSYRKNYASEKIVMAAPGEAKSTFDQKYERVSDLSAVSGDFDRDSAKALDEATAVGAVVQEENSYGLPGSRSIALTFGVKPEGFEPLVERLRAVGTLESASVTKTDKTAEFRALEARRISLEKTRDGLRALKAPGAALSDLISLETKILEIEGQIQETGVSLGDFAEDNSFCTVRFSLRERVVPNPWARVPGALFDALEWSTLTFLAIAFAATLALAAAVLASTIAGKIAAWRAKGEGRTGS